jgi:branched-chain amino acid transport system ATP-binding protein
VHSVRLDVNAGEIVTVIGANGAGKTTCCAHRSASCPGTRACRCTASASRALGVRRMVARGVALVPERPRACSATMSVRENLLLGAYQRRKDKRDQSRAHRARVRDLPAPEGAPARRWPPRCRAASSRCSRSAAR